MFKLIAAPFIFLLVLLIGATVVFNQSQTTIITSQLSAILNSPAPTPTPAPKITLKTPPAQKVLPGGTHTFQSFNNCGPASLSMALSHLGVTKSQIELGQALRPYQNPQGDNDDKSVTLAELARKAEEFGFTAYHRPNGNIDLIKLFITYDIPVITRTITKPNEDIGHFRVIKGYDTEDGTITQDDSLQGKNLQYTIGAFNILWETFNYEYVVIVPKDKQEIAESILGAEADYQTSWKNAVKNSETQLAKSPHDVYSRFNLSVALYNVGDYKRSVAEFEKVESQLSFRTLWYQIEPIQAYYQLGNYQKVFEITDKILNNQNRAFSELYILRGEIYKKQGNTALAKAEFEKAVLYNKNLRAAQQALESVN